MRKAAYILGIVCVVLSLAGIFLKLNSLPGGSTLLILFTSLFSLGAMPLYLYSISKIETEKREHFAIRLCGFSFAVFQIGLLFFAQRWPDSLNIVYAGAAGLIVWLIVFVLKVRNSETKAKEFSLFGLLAVLILLTLAGASYDRVKDEEIEAQQYAALESVNSKYAVVVADSYQYLNELGGDSLDYNDSVKKALLMSGIELQSYIESLKDELITISNYGIGAPIVKNEEILRPWDHDIPTFLLVGVSPANPTGRGPELYDKLLSFRKSVLPENVNFAVPVSNDGEMRVQWVKDNFYHATVVEALTRLTKIQIEICTSVNTAVESNTNE